MFGHIHSSLYPLLKSVPVHVLLCNFLKSFRFDDYKLYLEYTYINVSYEYIVNDTLSVKRFTKYE